MCTNEATLQNFIYKRTADLENVQRNKEKGEFTGHRICYKLDFKRVSWFD
jgi:hypothetical protein